MSRWFIGLGCLLMGGLAGSLLRGPVLKGDNLPATGIAKELTSYRDVVKKVLPAVVSVEAKAKIKPQPPTSRRKPKLDDLQIPEDLRKFLEEFQRGPGDGHEDAPQFGFGSGFVVDPKGVIMTNFHVVDGADQAEIRFIDGKKLIAKKILGDRKTDVAILRVESATPLPHLDLGDSDAMEIGDRVLAVGAPFGLTGSVTHGIISAKGRAGMHMNLYEDFLQTDAPINPGNSGGPLVNLEGQVIGMNAAIKSRSGGFQGVGLAIPSTMAKNVMQQLLTDGVVHRGYLGVQIKDLDDADVAAKLGVKENTGVVVGQIFESSPAGKAGVQPGDIITNIGGKPVTNGRELQKVVAAMPLRKAVSLTVIRDGKKEELSVTIEEQPDDFGAAAAPAPRFTGRRSEALKLEKLGAEVADLTPDLAEDLGYKESTKGALITRVEPDGPAAAAGLRKGMIVMKVDKQMVQTATGLKDAVEGQPLDEGVLLQVQSPRDGIKYVVVKTDAEK